MNTEINTPMTPQIDVEVALKQLKARYPKESVKVSIELKAEDCFEFMATVGDLGDSEIGWSGQSLTSAINHLFDRAGSRDPAERRQKKLAEIQKQIEELHKQKEAVSA